MTGTVSKYIILLATDLTTTLPLYRNCYYETIKLLLRASISKSRRRIPYPILINNVIRSQNSRIAQMKCAVLAGRNMDARNGYHAVLTCGYPISHFSRHYRVIHQHGNGHRPNSAGHRGYHRSLVLHGFIIHITTQASVI
jgi:hypothetical protein